MLHIYSTKLRQKAFEGKPWKATITLRLSKRHANLASSQRWRHRRALLVKKPIVVGPCFVQPMPPLKSYTLPHKNLILLISFPCWVQVCNISTKAVLSFFCLSMGGMTESPVLLGILPAHSDFQDIQLLSPERLKSCFCSARVIIYLLLKWLLKREYRKRSVLCLRTARVPTVA